MSTAVGGPYFDELEVGMTFDTAPAVTLTDGLAASHRAILGDRLRLPLDHGLSRLVTGAPTPLASPSLVWDLAIGQSTLATHHVKANLFYRGLRFRRFPHIGDTLTTRTTVEGLRDNAPKPGRAATGLAALHMTTSDQHGRTVLDFHRCAMLPVGPDADPSRGRRDQDLTAIGVPTGERAEWAMPQEWDLAAYRRSTASATRAVDLVGRSFATSGDVVSSAPELARLSLNIAAVHHDERVGGSRLVYGGHTIGLALAQTTRALPDLVTILGWESCDHTGPVRENDTLTSHIEVLGHTPLRQGSALHLRCLVAAHRADTDPAPVLDWRYTALVA
ncbi:MaoC family dehydratase [Nocardioides sp. BP30]|uniref:MaoC family dehydratase n=1 Tax=Nocardioides sp. BP30 TaxID=3036374 RepID=UPI0024683C81|nr:MaoC family dehydratase [Nocardioides sp. BP30]WGL54093.1 MaoC family dehydratase [Nocardioides sp. BP30]